MRNRSENDPSVVRPQTRPSRNPRTAKIDHQGSRTDFLWKNTTHETVSHPSRSRSRSSTFGGKHMVSYSCFLSKTNFVLGFVQNSIANSPNSTTCNPIFTKGTVLKLQITMQFHRQPVHIRSYNHKSQLNSVDRKNTKQRWHPIYNPWKNIDFRESGISQNAFPARLPSMIDRQLPHQHNLQSHLQ